MAKVNTVSRGRTNIKIGRFESAIVFSTTGVHNALSEDSRQFIDDMLTKGESEAFKDITPEKFWTVVLPAVTYVKMAQYIKEVQQSNSPEEQEEETVEATPDEAESVDETINTDVAEGEQNPTNEVPIDAFDG